jgi:hypothetical protein
MNEYVRKFRSHEKSYFPFLDRYVSVDQTVTISVNRGSVPRNVCDHPTWYSTMLLRHNIALVGWHQCCVLYCHDCPTLIN